MSKTVLQYIGIVALAITLVGNLSWGFDIRGTLEGQIIDKETKDPLVGVNVQITGTSYGDATDAGGFFEISGINAGKYDLRVSAVGYKILIVKQIIIRPDLRTRQDLELEAASVELEVIEVRASTPLIQKDLAATAFSVGAAKLEVLPLSSFHEVLSLQPGTTVEGNVRGGKTNEVVYLIDGLPVQDIIGGGLGTSIPKSSIAGLTMYTGGFEAEYGNALSGVVNVITKGGADRHIISTKIESDGVFPARWNEQQDKRTEFGLMASGPLIADRLFYFMAGNGILSDTRWRQDFHQFFPSPVSREYSGFGKLDYHFSPSLRIALQGIYSNSSWRDYEFSWRFNLTGLPVRSGETYRVAATLTHSLSNNTFYTTSISTYFNRSRIGEGSRDEFVPSPYQYDLFLRYVVSGNKSWWADSRQRIHNLKADVTHSIERSHLLKAGFELQQYDVSSDLLKYEPQRTYFGKPVENAPLLNYSNTYSYRPRSGSAYLQDKIELARDGANLSLGLRWDFLDPRAQRPIIEYLPVQQNEYQQVVKGFTPSSVKSRINPRIGFAAPVGTESFCFFNYGYYVQFPLFEYLYAGLNPVQIQTGTKSVLTGNPDLSPEETVAWELGFKHGISDHEVFSMTYFSKISRNQIDSKTLIPFDSKFAGDYGFASYVNNAESKAEGVEVVLSREEDERLSGSISYAFMWTEGLSEYVDQRVNYAQWGFPLAPRPFPLSWDQRHNIKMDLFAALLADIYANVTLLYNSPRPYTYYPTRDGFTSANSTSVLVPNNSRMESVLFLNMKIWKDFIFGVDQKIKLKLFADVRNLLNTDNVRWMDSNGRIGGELGDPSAYYDPRRVRVGMEVTM